MGQYVTKAALFGKKIYAWLSQFATVYRGVLPNSERPQTPYIQINGYFDTFASTFIFQLNIYSTQTTSYATVLQLADDIGNAIGEDGALITEGTDDIRIRVQKGSPFYQDKPDEDETVRAGLVNLEISIY